MANIKVKIEYPIKDGTSFTFHAPCDCSQVDGLTVTHPHGKQDFAFKDAHGNNLTGIQNLFVAGSLIQVILDVTNGAAFLQNADTNGYLEEQISVERERINELVAMESSQGKTVSFPIEDECVKGTIWSNGACAYIDVYVGIDETVIPFDDFVSGYSVGIAIPEMFVPIGRKTVDLEPTGNPCTGPYHVELHDGLYGGIWVITITRNPEPDTGNLSSSRYVATYAVEDISVSISELNDIRVGHNGTVYDTAGEAVRGQIGDLDGRLISLGENCANLSYTVDNLETAVDDVVLMTDDFNADLSDLNNRVVALEKGGTGGGDGNVAVAYAGVSITDDGNGNVTVEAGEDIPAVLFTEQELTDEQKAQARKNIGADGVTTPSLLVTLTPNEDGITFVSDKTSSECMTAYERGTPVYIVDADETFNGVIVQCFLDSGEPVCVFMCSDMNATKQGSVVLCQKDAWIGTDEGAWTELIGKAKYDADRLATSLAIERAQMAADNNARMIGDIEAALDSIIAIQESLIGGDGV